MIRNYCRHSPETVSEFHLDGIHDVDRRNPQRLLHRVPHHVEVVEVLPALLREGQAEVEPGQEQPESGLERLTKKKLLTLMTIDK